MEGDVNPDAGVRPVPRHTRLTLDGPPTSSTVSAGVGYRPHPTGLMDSHVFSTGTPGTRIVPPSTTRAPPLLSPPPFTPLLVPHEDSPVLFLPVSSRDRSDPSGVGTRKPPVRPPPVRPRPALDLYPDVCHVRIRTQGSGPPEVTSG